MNKITIVLAIVVLLVVVFVLGMNFDNVGFTGKAVKTEIYTYTKAICSPTGECIDVLIECKNGEVEDMTILSDLKNFSDIEDWTPPNKTAFCE